MSTRSPARRWHALAYIVAVLLVWPTTAIAPVAAQDDPKSSSDAIASAAVLLGLAMGGDASDGNGPLKVTISPDLNCAVNKVGDQDGEFFGDTACATLIAANGVLYRPADIPAGGSASPFTAFTPVSQTKTGTGTREDPWRITTIVEAAPRSASPRSTRT